MLHAVDTDNNVIKAAEQRMGNSWFGRYAYYLAQRRSAIEPFTYMYLFERHPASSNEKIGATPAFSVF